MIRLSISLKTSSRLVSLADQAELKVGLDNFSFKFFLILFLDFLSCLFLWQTYVFFTGYKIVLSYIPSYCPEQIKRASDVTL